MALDLPDGLELMDDVSAAAWIFEAQWPLYLGPGGADGPVRIGSFLPPVFDAYARILNPAGEYRTTRWRDLAARAGVVLGPETRFAEICGVDIHDASALDRVVPLDGCLPEDETRALARLLEAFTSTSDRCWFCVWVGQGTWWHGSHSLAVSDDGTAAGRAAVEEAERRSRDTDAQMRRAIQVGMPLRKYFLFRGSVSQADSFVPVEGNWFQSPNIWWPDDRAWCVVTEVDGYSSFVGGTRACVDAVLVSEHLETIEVAPEHRIGDDGFS